MDCLTLAKFFKISVLVLTQNTIIYILVINSNY